MGRKPVDTVLANGDADDWNDNGMQNDNGPETLATQVDTASEEDGDADDSTPDMGDNIAELEGANAALLATESVLAMARRTNLIYRHLICGAGFLGKSLWNSPTAKRLPD